MDATSSNTNGGHDCNTWPLLTAPAQSQTTMPILSSREPVSACNARVYIWKQHLAAFLANIPSLITGMALGWTAPAVPILLGQVEDPQPLRLTLEQTSWVGGVMPLASLGGALVAGPLAEKIGRKGALLLGAVPTLIGWLLMTFAGSSMWLLLIGRTLTGFAVGTVSGPAALYCEEIADIRVRGALGSSQHVMNCFGVIVIYALGALLPYFWFTAASLVLPLVFVLTFCWMPESPAYLAARNRHKDAHQALCWLRGPHINFQKEIDILLASKPQGTGQEQPKTCLSLCSQRPFQSNALRCLTIVLALMFFQQSSGLGMVTFYTVQIFQQVGGNLSSYLSSLIIGSANLIAVLTATATVDRIGRRFLLLMSSIAMGVCLLSLAIYTHLNSINCNMEGWKWVPLASLVIYGVMFSVGLGPLPWFLMAELLPMYTKGWASPAAVCMNRICMFIVVKESPLMLEYAGQVPTYVMFSIICFFASIFIFFFLPETKGKTKADILKEVGGNRP